MAIVHPNELTSGDTRRGYKPRNRFLEYLNPSGGRTHDLHRWLASRRVTWRSFGKELGVMSLISAGAGIGLGFLVWLVSGWTADNPTAVLMTSLVAGGAGILAIVCWRLLCNVAYALLGRRLEQTCQRC